jgi:hypothetical protein
VPGGRTIVVHEIPSVEDLPDLLRPRRTISREWLSKGKRRWACDRRSSGWGSVASQGPATYRKPPQTGTTTGSTCWRDSRLCSAPRPWGASPTAKPYRGATR